MKVLKKAEQKNVCLDIKMYTESEINDLAYMGYIFRIDDNDVWRVSLISCESISVKYVKESGVYTTVVKHIDGTELYVIL